MSEEEIEVESAEYIPQEIEEIVQEEATAKPTSRRPVKKPKPQGKKKVFLEKASTLSLLEEIANKEEAVIEKKQVRLKKQLEIDRETRMKIKKKRRERRVELNKFKKVVEGEKSRKKLEKAAVEQALKDEAVKNEGKKSVTFA